MKNKHYTLKPQKIFDIDFRWQTFSVYKASKFPVILIHCVRYANGNLEPLTRSVKMPCYSCQSEQVEISKRVWILEVCGKTVTDFRGLI